VALEGLSALSSADIPVLCAGIASTRDERVLVGGDGDAHDITSVVLELGNLASCLDIPEDASLITRAGEDALLVEEAAAGDVASVGIELTADADRYIARTQIIDRAGVVETTAGDEAAGGTVSAGHNPSGAEGDSVKLVGGETIPHKELTILRSTYKVVSIVSPLHGVDLRQMALKGTSDLELVVLGDRGDITSALIQGGILHAFPVCTNFLFQLIHCATCLLHPLVDILLLLTFVLSHYELL